MITKQQAMTEDHFHYGQCKIHVGPKGGTKHEIIAVRRNGKTQTWKTRPSEFKMPFKYGLYDHGYITQENAKDFHVASECKPVEIRKEA